jgi:hypothetical protein
MKWFLAFSFLFLTSCANQTTPNLSENSSNQDLVKTITETPTQKPSELNNNSEQNDDLCKDSEPLEIPKTDSPIGKTDFNNFSYPKILEKGLVKLKDGCFGQEITVPGLSIDIYTLESVEFLDFNGDGEDEALINVLFFSGGGSSGTSENYYIYKFQGKKLHLIWKIATGTRAYCGVKEYELKDKQIILELFGKCTVKADGNFKDEGKHKYDYSAEEYTKFVFGWTGNHFGVKSREVFPFPEGEIKEYLNRNSKERNEKNN